LLSVIPLYADEFKNEKYSYLFRSPSIVSKFVDTIKNRSHEGAIFILNFIS
jgi:hypothetical protein